MKSRGFQCKQFYIAHDQSSMKVSTDSLMLGSWIRSFQPKRVLDVGTGCGLLALMMAQRFHSTQIVGIDICADSLNQAKGNGSASPWPERLAFCQSPLQNFADGQFDLIITNPPYFAAAAHDHRHRNSARHQSQLTLNELIEGSKRLLEEGGRFACVLPYQQQAAVENRLVKHGFMIERSCTVVSRPDNEPCLILVQAILWRAINRTEVERREIQIYDDENKYTQEYRELCQPFYLRF